MKRPTNPEDYAGHISQPTRTWRVFCVECDHWRTIQLSAMAMIYVGWLGISAGSLDVDRDTIILRCNTCGADIEYLLRNDSRRERIIGQLLDRTARTL